MVLGEPFTVDGELYTPADTLNYDAVGYAALDDGAGVTAAHRTLPLPSYAEVTSLESGKTILVRIERRGPMTGKSLLSLSSAAAAQLGASDGAAVRVRRVNPPEAERAELRAGRAAPDRIATPKSLVEVLRRKLPSTGAATLAAASPPPKAGTAALITAPSAAASPQATAAYPLPSIKAATAPSRPVVVAQAEPAPVRAAIAAPAKPAAKPSATGTFVVQAAAFSSRANADRAAKAIGGTVAASGKFFRVHTGPFASRTQADAALAKVRAAGYSDARVTTAG
jgi:rare lipoprotein A